MIPNTYFFLFTLKTRCSTTFFKPQFSHLFKQQFLKTMTKQVLTHAISCLSYKSKWQTLGGLLYLISYSAFRYYSVSFDYCRLNLYIYIYIIFFFSVCIFYSNFEIITLLKARILKCTVSAILER